MNLTCHELKLHVSHLMSDFVPINSKYITRSAFQNILHQALIADGDGQCFGVLGSAKAGQIQTIQQVQNQEELFQKLSAWKQLNIDCVGLFHMEREEPPEYFIDMMNACYLDVSVNLDEKGRLDILAVEVSRTTNQKQYISLDMIEDGHSDSDE